MGRHIQARALREKEGLVVVEEDDIYMAKGVVVFGSINMDMVATAPTFPTPNTNQPGEKFQVCANPPPQQKQQQTEGGGGKTGTKKSDTSGRGGEGERGGSQVRN